MREYFEFTSWTEMCNTKWPTIMITREFYVLKMRFLSSEFHQELRIEAIGMITCFELIWDTYFLMKSCRLSVSGAHLLCVCKFKMLSC